MLMISSDFKANINTTFIQPVYKMMVDFIKTGAKGVVGEKGIPLFDKSQQIRREQLIQGSFSSLEKVFSLLHASEQQRALLPIIKDTDPSSIAKDTDRSDRVGSLISTTKGNKIPIENMAIQNIIESLRNLPKSIKDVLKEPARTFLAKLEASPFKPFADTCREMWTYNIENSSDTVIKRCKDKVSELTQLVTVLQLPDINPFIEKLMGDVKAKVFSQVSEAVVVTE